MLQIYQKRDPVIVMVTVEMIIVTVEVRLVNVTSDCAMKGCLYLARIARLASHVIKGACRPW